MTQSSQFQPRQILCLEHEQSRLYAEVIQVVQDRPVCWLRPLILEVLPRECTQSVVAFETSPQNEVDNEEGNEEGHEEGNDDNSQIFFPLGSLTLTSPLENYPQENYRTKYLEQSPPKTYDLRLSSDLLLPPALFRHALDTELIPLLGKVNSTEFSLAEAQTAHHLLRDFIQQVWQNHREVFPS